MSGVCFVTAIDSPEPLNWGLKVENIAAPMVLVCSRDMADALRDRGVPPHVSIITTELPHTPSLGDKLAWLRQAGRAGYPGAHGYYWLDIQLIYQHLSFEFLYSDLLPRAIARFATGPAYFIMPGYDADGFFGGPKASIEASPTRRATPPRICSPRAPDRAPPRCLPRRSTGRDQPI